MNITKRPAPVFLLSWPLLVAAVLLLSITSQSLGADDNDDVLIIGGSQVAAPAPTPAVAKKAKPAKKVAKQKKNAKAARQPAPIWYPTLYPNPLAFNMTWVPITDKTFAEFRALAIRQNAKARRLRVAVRAQPTAAAQNAIQQQMRKILEPMLTSEVSFAARATDLNLEERRKLSADGKAWFDKFLVGFIKKQDPNQQQMLLQGMQGVWFGNQQQQVESPREAIRVGVKKLVKDKLSKEKLAAYMDEFQKRDEFARRASVDSLVERIDEKVKLSPDQWKKITKSLNEHSDKTHEPQLEAFALNQSMLPGAPDQSVLAELSPAQQAVLMRINATSGQMFINGGIFGQMFGDDIQVLNDMDDGAKAEDAEPAADKAIAKPEAE